MAVSSAQRAQRALVSVLVSLAQAYGIALQVSRDSMAAEVLKAYRQVAKRTHPDKGGRKRDFQRLQAAKEAWDAAQKARPAAGRPSPAAAGRTGALVVSGLWSEKGLPGHRVCSGAVLLTYSGVWSVALWKRFVTFVRKHLEQWGVRRWCGTLERSDAGHLHVHLALQFRQSVDRPSKSFAWAGRVPNASANDYLGQGVNKNPRYYQQSVDRGFFYVFADKEGTQKDGAGQLCVDGNHVPCWVKSPRSSRYQVMGKWPLSLWQQHKLSHDTYEEYLFLCRDSVLSRKRNLDAVRQRDEEAAEAMERKATVKRDLRHHRPPLTKPAHILRVKALFRRAKAQAVARRCAMKLRTKCWGVVANSGAAIGS